jgi:hypothetical protein
MLFHRALLAGVVITAVAAQEPASAVPDLRAVVGHDFGERISSHAEVLRYSRALADASPRVRLVRYGESWQGRELFYLVIGSAANLARLDQVRAGMRRLADPRGLDDAAADELVATLPAVVWLAYSVHGNEISGSDAALRTARHLVSSDDEVAGAALRNALVIVDPLQNPDGRDRFVHWFRGTVGRWPDPDQQAAEHNEPWPGGRTNHYLFDMNRDWFAQTQPESAARVRAFLDWFPLVYVDLHEMGSDSTYYFPPPAEPLNPQITVAQRGWLAVFGRNNARWFDQRGFDYFTREVFDAFYPGYGEGWPMFHGAIGMTYEQASVRGLVVRRDDETVIHYRDSVERHFAASLATIETAARERAGLLRSFLDYRRAACRPEPEGGVTEYVLPPGRDPGRVARLCALLQGQGVEVSRANAPFDVGAATDGEGNSGPRTFPAGTFVVPVAQPARHLAHTLLVRHQPLEPEFVAEQDRRRRKKLPTEIYDVTAWSLPLLHGVECFTLAVPSRADVERLAAPASWSGRVVGGPARVGYVVPWGTLGAVRAAAALLHEKVRVHTAERPFRLGGRDHPAGTLIVRKRDNPDDLHERLVRIAGAAGVDVFAVDSSWVDDGIDLGSNHVKYVVPPRVALVYERPTRPNSVGFTRFVLERSFGYPVTLLNGWQLSGADLRRYDVLIVPDVSGDAGAVLGAAAERLKGWVHAGGTLVTFGEATRWLTDEKVALLASARELDDGSKARAATKVEPGEKTDAGAPGAAGKQARPEPFDLLRTIEPDEDLPDAPPGAIVRVDLDPDHWLAAGYGGRVSVLVQSRNIFTPVKLDKGRNVGVFAREAVLVESGLVWDETRRQIAQKAYLVHQPHGRGQVIAFAEDPNYRAYCDGLNVLFANAVLLGVRR